MPRGYDRRKKGRWWDSRHSIAALSQVASRLMKRPFLSTQAARASRICIVATDDGLTDGGSRIQLDMQGGWSQRSENLELGTLAIWGKHRKERGGGSP